MISAFGVEHPDDISKKSCSCNCGCKYCGSVSKARDLVPPEGRPKKGTPRIEDIRAANRNKYPKVPPAGAKLKAGMKALKK